MEEKQELLKIENLTIEFDTETGIKQVINGLDLVIHSGIFRAGWGAGAGKTRLL